MRTRAPINRFVSSRDLIFLDMPDHFSSAKLTLSRAQHHINDLDRQIIAFVDEHPWSYVVERDENTAQYAHKIRFERRLPSDLPSILFDAVNNLRAVLDQVAYASAIAAKAPSLKAVKFPFASDIDHWDNAVNGGCKDLVPEIQALFRSCNAYKGGNDTLWALNDLCNTQKHFALVPFSTGRAVLAVGKEDAPVATPIVGGRRITVLGEVMFNVSGPISPKNPSWDPVKNEIILMMTTDLPSHLNYQPTVTVNVAIEAIDTQSGKPAICVLNAMGNEVRRIAMATEARCRELGLIS